ncbi:hypothetical protein IKF28_00795 [Candidatus Saccharibacteria bacterium]|nr:hypothetical protein [Candidatus Saccharibacteria bacterium]
MAKSLFLMILAGIIGILNPGSFLTATDSVPVADLSDNYSSSIALDNVEIDDNSAKTNDEKEAEAQTTAYKVEVAKSEVKSNPVVNSTSKSDQKTVSNTSNKTTVKKTTVQPVTPSVQNYTVTRYIGSVEEYTRTFDKLSYNDIYKFRKMIYGHNTSNLLGNLKSRYVGEIIKVTEGGSSKKYRVASVTTYSKADVAKLMNKIANSAMGHDVAFLTCAGTPVGQGDATHRLVVLADAI